jgi:hypothetical protein
MTSADVGIDLDWLWGIDESLSRGLRERVFIPERVPNLG